MVWHTGDMTNKPSQLPPGVVFAGRIVSSTKRPDGGLDVVIRDDEGNEHVGPVVGLVALWVADFERFLAEYRRRLGR